MINRKGERKWQKIGKIKLTMECVMHFYADKPMADHYKKCADAVQKMAEKDLEEYHKHYSGLPSLQLIEVEEAEKNHFSVTFWVHPYIR
jgi:hypothetical protein